MVIFIFLSAFFSSAETAITAINRVKLKSLAENSQKNAQFLVKMMANPRSVITAILIGNNIANVAASALATTVAFEMMKTTSASSQAMIVAVITGIMTFVILVFGEITPKTMAIRHPTRWALRIASLIYFVLLISKPAVLVFNYISKSISWLLRVQDDDVKRLFTVEDLKSAIQIGKEDGLLEAEEQDMIEGVIEFADKIVREVMTPRTDAVCMEVNSSPQEIIQLIAEKGHSRIPIYKDKIDNIVGIIYAKDLLTTNSDQKSIKPFMRDAVFIPETKNIEELLQQMKKSKLHMAIAVDEHGGMAGLVTLEDIIEEIIGEIQDEYDHEMSEFVEINKYKYVVAATLNIDDFAEKINLKVPDDAEYDTVGGFVLSLLGSVPEQGEIVSYENITFKVLDIKNRRIITLEVKCNTDLLTPDESF